MSDVPLETPVAGADAHVFPPTAAEDEKRSTRRRLTRLSLLGAAVVGAIARTWADAPDAGATPYCCDLYYPNGPWCGGSPGTGNFTCPSGYYKRDWTCCAPAGLVTCWECTKSTTCWAGPYACSNYSIGPGC